MIEKNDPKIRREKIRNSFSEVQKNNAIKHFIKLRRGSRNSIDKLEKI